MSKFDERFPPDGFPHTTLNLYEIAPLYFFDDPEIDGLPSKAYVLASSFEEAIAKFIAFFDTDSSTIGKIECVSYNDTGYAETFIGASVNEIKKHRIDNKWKHCEEK